MSHRSALGPSHIFPGAGAATVEAVPAQPETPAVVEAPAPVVEWTPSMKKSELLAVAVAKGLNVGTSSTKAEIVSALEAASAR